MEKNLMIKCKSRTKRGIWILVTIFCILINLSVSGCGLLNKDKEQSPESEEKAPKQLEEIESSIENIFKALGAPAVTSDQEDSEAKGSQDNEASNEKEKGAKGEEQKGEKQEQGDDKQSEEKQSEEKQGDEQQGEKQSESGEQKEESDPWKNVSQEIKQLHTKWNEYMPEAAKKSSDSKIIDDFSDSLNTLTGIIEEQDKTGTLMATNDLHSNIPELYSLYKTKHSEEIKNILFYTRSSILYSLTETWDEVQSNMDDLEATWVLLQSALDKEQLEPANKLNLSVYELEKVVEQKDQQLINIKGRIVLKNIEELEKSIAKNSE